MKQRCTTLCFFFLATGFTVMHGCAHRPLPPSTPQTSIPSVVESTPPPLKQQSDMPGPEPEINHRSVAVQDNAPSMPSKPIATLMAKAEFEFNAGRLDHSAANLERAIRIEPRNPVLWHNLAAIRLQQGRYAQAESMASKSNSLIAPGAALERKNWQIIAEARRLMGDIKGAKKAQSHAR